MSMKWFRTSVFVLGAVVLTSCAAGQASQDDASPNFEPLAPAPTQSDTTPVESLPEATSWHCPEFEDALQLVNEWADALTSRGTETHDQNVTHFKELVEDLNADSAQAGGSCPAFDELANLETQISGVHAMTESLDVVDDRFYQAVTNAGNEWLSAGDHGGLIFKEP